MTLPTNVSVIIPHYAYTQTVKSENKKDEPVVFVVVIYSVLDQQVT